MSGYEPSSVEVSSLSISFLSSVQFHARNDKLVVGAQPFYSCCKLILAHHRLTWAVIVRATTTVIVRAFRWCSARGTHVVNGDCVLFGTLGEQSRFLNGRLRVTSYFHSLGKEKVSLLEKPLLQDMGGTFLDDLVPYHLFLQVAKVARLCQLSKDRQIRVDRLVCFSCSRSEFVAFFHYVAFRSELSIQGGLHSFKGFVFT